MAARHVGKAEAYTLQGPVCIVGSTLLRRPVTECLNVQLRNTTKLSTCCAQVPNILRQRVLPFTKAHAQHRIRMNYDAQAQLSDVSAGDVQV